MNAADFLGKPWRERAFGPDAFDCWGLTFVAARALFGLDFPPLQATAADALLVPTLRRVRVIERPKAGAVLGLMDMRGRLKHVALCLDEFDALHTTKALGSRIEPIASLTRFNPRAELYEWIA